MKMFVVLLATSMLAASLIEPSWAADEDAYARTPKEIAFQNDTQWEDNRWQKTDVGPFLAGIIEVGKDKTLKGVAVRVGENGEAAVCFDTARMRMSAAWTGEFLRFGSRRFGLLQPPQAGGDRFFSTDKVAGWAKDDRFVPTDDEMTGPASEHSWDAPSNSETRLPKDWAHYRGHYTVGDRVVFSYSVGKASVLESPWFVSIDTEDAFVRSIEVSGCNEEMQMWVAGDGMKVTVIGDDTFVKVESDRPVLRIAPRQESVVLNLLITKRNLDPITLDDLRRLAGEPIWLSAAIMRDSGRFHDVLTTTGTTTAQGGPYVIDTLTLPFENPWNALLFTAGHDFFSDGSAAVCTVHGDVWTVSGIDRNLKELKWRRFATGLCQPLGLRIVDDKVYVIGRNQVTRLHDRNVDGEADFYENFNNDILISGRAHDFVACLDSDQDGNFYFIHANTGVMKLTSDGSSLTTVADGFRNPNGLGVSPDGLVTAAPQQGTWTPESSLIVVKEGGYYGFGGPRITDDRPTGWDLPAFFIPRSMDNSGGGQTWVQGDQWGPLEGLMLHFSYGQCRMLLALTEEVDGVYQGGTIQFPTTPNDFESGVMRGRFHPHDGQLYVSGLRGWQTRSIRDGCLQRVRYTGGLVSLPTAVKTYTNGIKLTFTEALDPEMASNADNFFAEQWNYLWSEKYGSPQFSVQRPQEQGRDEVEVVSATLMDDGHSVFLEMPGRQIVNQLSINWLLASSSGEKFRGTFAHTINREPTETMPDSLIVRKPQPSVIRPDVMERLQPNVLVRYRQNTTEQVDTRTSRLIAIRQDVEQPATPFLDAGPFALEAVGTLRVPRSGLYDFKLEGSGNASLLINGALLVDLSSNPVTSEGIMLRKGHNQLRLEYQSPPTGVATLKLLWQGYDFGWEPVPPEILFHDSGDRELMQSQMRRRGRELFADHRCANCHKTDIGEHPMFELTLDAPSLANVGNRLRGQWLARWIYSPSALRSDAHMPAMLGEGDAARQAASDIAAFLAEDNPSGDLASDVSVNDGDEWLFETVGCIVCHHFEATDEEDEFARRTLQGVDAKYRPGALVAFLKKPNAHHTSIRMPDFNLTDDESISLARFVRAQSKQSDGESVPVGDASRGAEHFRRAGCQQCHAVGEASPILPANLVAAAMNTQSGCLAEASSSQPNIPHFGFTRQEHDSLASFFQHDTASLSRSDAAETSSRLFAKLQCGHCHDRDGMRSHRALVIAQEGSGQLPETLPSLTSAGEKLKASWTRRLIAGELGYKARPWLRDRMPAFPDYANSIATGLAAEHGVDPNEQTDMVVDANLVATGEKLTLQTGLDCRQCHAIGDLEPRGDKDTKIALGINFSYVGDRMRHDAYQRFMLDPPRYDINTRMIKLSEDGLTTKLKDYFDADAEKQFEAVWHYIQSLPEYHP